MEREESKGSGQSLVQEDTKREAVSAWGGGHRGSYVPHCSGHQPGQGTLPMLSPDALGVGGSVLIVVCSFSSKIVHPRGRHYGQTYS